MYVSSKQQWVHKDDFGGERVPVSPHEEFAPTEFQTIPARDPGVVYVLVRQKLMSTPVKVISQDHCYPAHMYVPATAVAKGGATFAAALLVFSLVVRISTGFSMIDPFLCVIGLVAAGTFYAMGANAESRAGNNKRT